MQSENIGELAAALAKAQAAIPPVRKDKTAKIPTKAGSSYSYSYSDLAGIWDAIRSPLSDNGLSVVQMPGQSDGWVSVETMLMHASGQWISSTVSARTGDTTPQAIGSAITYLRRYALGPMIGVVSDDDDDGNTASQPQAQPAQRTVYAPPATVNTATGEIVDPSVVSDKQYGLIKGLIKKGEWQESDWIDWAKQAGYQIETLQDLSKRQATDMIDALKAGLDKPVEAAPF